MFLFRVLSAQPQSDGEHWKVSGRWMQDVWHTDAYGQDPAPFQRNPQLQPRIGPPYPWQAVGEFGASYDQFYPLGSSFIVSVDTSSYPAQLSFTGNLPVNVPAGGDPPVVPLLATTSNTGGTILPGTYSVAVSWHGYVGPVSSPVTAVVPAGTNTNTITVSGISWPNSTAPGWTIYIGPTAVSMIEVLAGGGAGVTGSSPDANGNPTVITITAIQPFGVGLPDNNAQTFDVEELPIEHGGAWGDTVTSAAGSVLTFSAGAWTTNQWQNRVLSLYYRPGATNQPIINLKVLSNTANTLTMDHGDFQAGDVVAMRLTGGHISPNTIGDDNLINSYAPAGLDTSGSENGRLIHIIRGTGANQPPKTVLSCTSKIYTIAGTWDVTPDATSIWIVTSATVAYSYQTKTFTNDGSSTFSGVIAQTPAITKEFQSLLIRIATADAAGNSFPMRYQPMREVYIPPQTIGSSSAGGEHAITPVTVTRTLAAAITNTATTCTLDATTGLLSGPFLLTLASGECVRVTARTGVSVTAMDRGWNGTTPAAQANGSTAILTTATPDLSAGVAQSLTLGTFDVTLTDPTGAPGPTAWSLDVIKGSTSQAVIPSGNFIGIGDGTPGSPTHWDTSPMTRYVINWRTQGSGTTIPTGGNGGPYPLT